MKRFSRDVQQNLTDALLLDSALTGLGIPIEQIREENLGSVRALIERDRNASLGFCLGLASNMVYSRSMGRIDELRGPLELAGRFLERKRYDESVVVLFNVALALELVWLRGFDGPQVDSLKQSVALLFDEIGNHVADIHSPELKVAVVYLACVLKPDKMESYWHENEKTIYEALETFPIETKVFLLKPLLRIHQTTRHRVLFAISDFLRKREYGEAERNIVSKILGSVLSLRPQPGVQIERAGEEESPTLRLILTLSPDEVAGLTRPRIQQLALVALGLAYAGYHSSYTLPLIERQDYAKYIESTKDKTQFVFVRKPNLERLTMQVAVLSYQRSLIVAISLFVGSVIASYVLSFAVGPFAVAPVLILLFFFLAELITELRQEKPLVSYLVLRKSVIRKMTQETYERVVE